ncbi:MAG: hypothetical protein V4520_18550 [Bacteroidota bacterium]
MSFQFDENNQFIDCGINFPTTTFCGAVLNDFLINGLSINQFEEKYKRMSQSKIVHNPPSFKSGVQYNLTSDIWGPKEILLIFKKNEDFDVALVYGMRNGQEFATVDSYLKTNPKATLMQTTPGSRYYNVELPHRPNQRSRALMINLVKENEQASKTTLLIKF